MKDAQILNIQEIKQNFIQRDLHKLVSEQLDSDNDLSDDLNNLVRMNILAFTPTTSSYTLQGNSMYYGLKQYMRYKIQKPPLSGFFDLKISLIFNNLLLLINIRK